MPKSKKKNNIQYDIIGVSLTLLSIYFYISLFSQNAGIIGNTIRHVLLGVFGLGAYVFPILLTVVGIAFVYMKGEIKLNIKFYSFCIFLVATLLLLYILNLDALKRADLNWRDTIIATYNLGAEGYGKGGGAISGILGYAFVALFGVAGCIAIIIGSYIIAGLMFTRTPFAAVLEYIKKAFKELLENVRAILNNTNAKNVEEISIIEEADENDEYSPEYREKRQEIKEIDRKIKILDFTKQFGKSFKPDGDKSAETQQDKPEDKPARELPKVKDLAVKKKAAENGSGESEAESNESKIISMPNVESKHFSNYKMPSLNLLSLPVDNKQGNTKKEVMNNVKILEETLKNFGVSASIAEVAVGPTITRYELQLSPGVKVSKILSLADDISLNLASPGIRIEAPIPGKAAIGIEVPNKDVTSVLLREVLESDDFRNHKSKLSVALGKDVAGANIIADLSKMPHLLIAGSTGSGKSVCINTLITSILYKATPEEVKLLMIDPKVVELSIYKNIPHLLVPVVTDPKKAAGALNWAVQEMTERYKKFASNNVRDITGYNSIEKEGVDKLPQIVVIIDELADLMMVAPGEVEDSICRLAQMARAAGIHLVVATQRPSVDVITGLIKANIPSRISFAVSSQIDSRTILDMAGAEKLLGKGDMLFYPVGEAKPIRAQGAFISEKEVERLVNFIKDQVPAAYNDDIIKELEQSVEIDEGDVDELLKDAIQMVVESGQASILMLQRRLKIGYSRAARLIDQMEERRIVGGYEGSKPRKVLISKEQFEEMLEE